MHDIHCNYCGGRHATAQLVRACFESRSVRVASQQPPVPATPRRRAFSELSAEIDFPAKGILHFALPSKRHPDHPFLFVVKRGRKPGHVFVNRITAQGGTKLDVEDKDQLWALDRLVADQAAAEKLYAASTEHCSRCDKFLSDPKSIDRGYGPDCWAKIQARSAA